MSKFLWHRGVLASAVFGLVTLLLPVTPASAANLTVTGTLSVTGPGTALVVTNSGSIGGNLSVGGNFVQSGAGTFGTGTGAVSLNGNTSITGAKTLTVGTGATSLGGTLTVAGATALNGATTVNSTLAVKGSGGISVGVAASTQGKLALFTTGAGAVTLQSNAQGNNLTLNIPADTNLTDTVCLLSLGNCTAVGSAGGDLTGTYPNPIVANLQGNTLTITTPSSGQILQYNGSAFVNNTVSGDITINGGGVATIGAGKVTNADLANSGVAITAGTGLTGGGSVSLGGSSPALNVAYGSIAGTAAQGNTTITCPTGGTNVTGGGNVITVGAGGSCGALSVVSNPSFADLNSSGTVTFSGLNTSGVVHTNGSGILSTGAVALGTDTSGNYVANLGTLTGLSTTGNSGAGSSPNLSVTYGSSANTAVQGNTSLTCASGTGNLTGGGNALTLGAGGTCNPLAITNNPTFSGLTTLSGGVNISGNTSINSSLGFSNTNIGNPASYLTINAGNTYIGGNTTINANLGVQGSGGLTLGAGGYANGILSFANASGNNQVVLRGLNPSGTGNANIQIPSVAGGSTDTICLQTLANCTAPAPVAVNNVGTIDSQTKSANGAVISGSTIYLQSADAVNIGLVTAGTQTFGGDKTFNGNTRLNGVLSSNNSAWFSDLTVSNSLGITDLGNFAQYGSGTFATGAGAVSLNGNTTITGSNSLTVGTGATSLGGGLTVSGVSNFNDLLVAHIAIIDLGNFLQIGNGTFSTGSGDVHLNGDTTVASGKKLTNNGATVNGALALADQPSGGNIGTASSTVDTHTYITIAQSTAGQTLSLPSPTSTQAGAIVYVSNVGSTAFTLNSATLNPNETAGFIWNGSSWSHLQ